MLFSTFLPTLVALSSLSFASASASLGQSSALVSSAPNTSLDRRTLSLGCILFGTGCDYSSDPLNCGSKGHICATSWPLGGLGASCVNGVCGASSCSGVLWEFSWLTGQCISVASDNSNCGACGTSCSTSSSSVGTGCSQAQCSSGTCVATSCSSGYTLSGGKCSKTINTTSDTANCGKVGNVCPSSYSYGTGSICANSLCQPSSCNSGYAFNFSTLKCIPILTDMNNCGSCGNICSFPHGTGTCKSGTCTLSSCSTGYQDVNGVCTLMNIQTDPSNCGAVGKCCTYSNGIGSCSNGVCSLSSCNTGYKISGSTCVAINTSTDVNNCGAVGKICPSSYQYGSGSVTCSSGVCTSACQSGYAFNANIGGVGYCQNVQSDPSNCGSCGNVCKATNGVASCSAGKCTISSCNSGYYLVNGVCTSLNLTTDPNNCGAVGKVCSANAFSNGSGVECSAGVCRPVSCIGLYDYDASSNSCIPVGTDMNNCGACGSKCSVPNGVAQCLAGVCSVKSCISGYTNINGVCTSVNTASDPNNCGAVGKVCSFKNGAGSCKSGVCTYSSCSSPYVLAQNVCSLVDLLTDPNNCGSVGHQCQSTYLNGGAGACLLGFCVTTCSSLFAWDPLYLFCRPVGTDLNNCGACGSVCNPSGSATAQCSGGKCSALSCKTGYTLSNGACVSIDTTCDVNNCGSVGHPCSFSPSGASGICQNSKCVTTSCPTKYSLVNGVCVLTASQRARLAKKDSGLDKRTLCPAGETACPILGSASYDLAVTHHFTAVNEFSGIMAGSGGYECLDVKQSLDSCGGCASTGEGQDCTKIRGAVGVGCDDGKCVVFSCLAGWRANIAGTKCVRAHTEHSGSAHNTTRTSAPRRHLQARHGHAHAAHGHS